EAAGSPSAVSTTAPAASYLRCQADEIRLSVALTDSLMSQPFSDIALTNTGTTPCVLSGYPHLTSRPAMAVHHGLYEREDPGPHAVLIRPNHDAFFSVGTAAAYQGGRHPITLRRLTVVLPGTHVAKTVTIHLLATRPPGTRIPVGITA